MNTPPRPRPGPPYREAGERDHYEEETPMDETALRLKMVQWLIVAAVVLAAMGLGTYIATSRHADDASVQQRALDAQRAEHEANKAMFEQMMKAAPAAPAAKAP